MFSRRLATFLLGIWLGGCLLIDLMALQDQRTVNRLLANPSAEARERLVKSEDGSAELLLRHLAKEQTRANLSDWEFAQMVLCLTIVVLLTFTDQRKPLAIGLCASMGLLTIIQHQIFGPDLSFLGRQADFLPEAAAFNVRTQLWARTQGYGFVEALKLLAGGTLASYFFGMESTVRRSRSRARSGGEESPLTASREA